MKPILVIMAAGLGSRYGGLKQIDPVDDARQIIIDYSIFDAAKAGFETVVCIIKPEMEADFDEVIGNRIRRHVALHYAYQRPDVLPEGFSVPQGRTKPWGTAHAVLCAREWIHAPFAVINADDFYGRTAFQAIYDFLASPRPAGHHAMVGYRLENTLTEHGTVARGVCKVSRDGKLLEIVERLSIAPCPGGALYREGQGETFLPDGTTVSMNLWGFQPDFMEQIAGRFADFLRDSLPRDPLKCEYFLPFVANQLLAEGTADITVLPTHEKWHGVTYQEDMARVRQAIGALRRENRYPQKLWGV